MSKLDWAVFIMVVIAALIQLYFGSKYRDIFVIDSATINKSYISQIRNLNQKHPTAGRIYIFLVSVQILGIVTIATMSFFQ